MTLSVLWSSFLLWRFAFASSFSLVFFPFLIRSHCAVQILMIVLITPYLRTKDDQHCLVYLHRERKRSEIVRFCWRNRYSLGRIERRREGPVFHVSQLYTAPSSAGWVADVSKAKMKRDKSRTSKICWRQLRNASRSISFWIVDEEMDSNQLYEWKIAECSNPLTTTMA